MKIFLSNITCFFIFISIGFSQSNFTSLDVFELEWVTSPQISPDGNWIVYERRAMDIMKDRKTSKLWLMKSDGSYHQKLTNREVNESNPRWSPDGSRIAFKSGSDSGSEIFVFWHNTNVFSKLTNLERSPKGISWSPDGKQIAFSMLVPESAPKLVSPPKKPKGAKWAAHPRVTTRLKHEADGSGYIEPGFSHLFVIPSEGGSARQITKGDVHHRGTPNWTKDGKSLVISSNLSEKWEYEWRNSEIYSIDINTGKSTSLTSRNGPDRSPAISPNGKKILYVGYDDKVQTNQNTLVYVMNIDGSENKQVNINLDRSFSSPEWSPDGKGFYVQYDDLGNTKIAYVSLSGKISHVTKNLGGTSIGRPYGGGSYSVSDNDRIVFTHTTPYHPSELAWVKRGSDTKLLTGLNDDILGHRTLGEVEEIWYKSSFDKRDIQGWIVTPPDFDSLKTYPLIVENHGGPIANYGDRFSPEMQLYASAGYVVFYPNPRGSTSYGEEFGNLLYHNYPGEDYNDVMDGVDAMVRKRYIDKDQLFVTGGSAGGIMTAWMIGKNNRFKAAAVVKPVMNWISKTLTADNYYGYANSRYPGQPWENIEAYMKFSPISLVGNVETPTLVMVGTSDLRTPLSEAKQLYHAMKIRKIETALVEIPGSYHFISNKPSQLITKIDHILAWFELYR